MLIYELSDCHLEQYQDPDRALSFLNKIRPVETGDVLVLAGDIASLGQRATMKYFDEFRKWAIEIVYVPGNHEHYNMNPRLDGKAVLDTLQSEGIRVLGPEHMRSFTYQEFTDSEPIKFVGSTLWYPYNQTTLTRVMNWSDKGFIKDFLPWWIETQKAERELLWQEMTEGSIVVTHMLPSWICVDPQFSGDPDNVLYVADVEDMMLELKPRLWFSGHSHTPQDIYIGDTRCVRNPIGYPSVDTTKYSTVLSINI